MTQCSMAMMKGLMNDPLGQSWGPRSKSTCIGGLGVPQTALTINTKGNAWVGTINLTICKLPQLKKIQCNTIQNLHNLKLAGKNFFTHIFICAYLFGPSLPLIRIFKEAIITKLNAQRKICWFWIKRQKIFAKK
jgi:hypothetical protein